MKKTRIYHLVEIPFYLFIIILKPCLQWHQKYLEYNIMLRLTCINGNCCTMPSQCIPYTRQVKHVAHGLQTHWKIKTKKTRTFFSSFIFHLVSQRRGSWISVFGIYVYIIIHYTYILYIIHSYICSCIHLVYIHMYILYG